jgi:hypothetical protein
MPPKNSDKDFRLPKVSYVDFKTIDVDRVLLNLFPRLKFNGGGGRIKNSDYKIQTFVDEFLGEELRDKFRGFEPYQDVVYKWVETDLLDLVNRGRAKEAVVAPRPLHGNVYKFRNTKHARDYNASEQLYWMLHHARGGLGQSALDALRHFIFAGLDWNTDRMRAAVNIDVETQAILHLDSQVKQDKQDSKEPERHPPLCAGQADILADDVLRLLSYENYMPRSVMVEYLKTLFSFHLALYHLRLLKLLPVLVERAGGDPHCARCPVRPREAQAHGDCPHQLGLVVDFGAPDNRQMAELARRSTDLHYRRITGFIQAQFVTKKLDEMVNDQVKCGKLARPSGRDFTVAEVLEFAKPKHKSARDAYFWGRLPGLLAAASNGEGEDLDPEIRRITEMELGDFERYIEILVTMRGKFHRKYLIECLDALLQKNRDGGLLKQQRGGRAERRFFMGTRLLEVLLQIAVLRPQGAAYVSAEIRVDDLLQFLIARYGIYVDRLPDRHDSVGPPSIIDRQALRRNLEGFKMRLREIGFFQDLSDAWVTQTVTPRYQISRP